MASTEEVLKALQNANIATLAATEPEELVIDAESRTITVPSSERLFGVTGDKDVERKYFQCPKIVGDNIDLSQHQIYISYVFTTSENNTIFPTIGNGRYHCEDVEVSGDNITFSWLLSGNVLSNPGFIAFKVMAMKNEGDELKTKWNTAPAFGTVLITVPDGEDIAEEYPDVINQIFDRLDALESGGGGGTGGTTNYEKLSNKPKLNGVTLEGNKTLDQVGVLAKNQGSNNSGKFLSVGSNGDVTLVDPPTSGGSIDPEQVNQAVEDYLTENPVSGMTAEQEEQLSTNTQDITNLKSDMSNKALPPGGTTGQILKKKSETDYDVGWENIKSNGIFDINIKKWFGKKIIVDGSSITSGGVGNTQPTWFTFIKQMFALSQVYNHSLSGSNWMYGARYASSYSRLKEYEKDANAIIIMGDFSSSYSNLGSMSDMADAEGDTYYSRLKGYADSIINLFPNIPIIWVIEPPRSFENPSEMSESKKRAEEISKAIKEVGEYYGFPVSDCFHKTIFRPYMSNNYEITTSDGTHPWNNIQRTMAQIIAETMKETPIFYNESYVIDPGTSDEGGDIPTDVELVDLLVDSIPGYKIYENDTVDKVKESIKVVAVYSDLSEKIIRNYDISGSFNAGIQTFTISYSGKEKTIELLVTEGKRTVTVTLSQVVEKSGCILGKSGNEISTPDSLGYSKLISVNPSETINLKEVSNGWDALIIKYGIDKELNGFIKGIYGTHDYALDNSTYYIRVNGTIDTQEITYVPRQ